MDVYWWYTGFFVALAISMALLVKATQTLPLGTAYAVWTGIGAVGSALVGIIVFKLCFLFFLLFFFPKIIFSMKQHSVY